jgi:hypothetical protein
MSLKMLPPHGPRLQQSTSLRKPVTPGNQGREFRVTHTPNKSSSVHIFTKDLLPKNTERQGIGTCSLTIPECTLELKEQGRKLQDDACLVP